MAEKHKHSELIKAWADGAVIEFRTSNHRTWTVITNPSWGEQCEYRVKPEDKPKPKPKVSIGEIKLGEIVSDVTKLRIGDYVSSLNGEQISVVTNISNSQAKGTIIYSLFKEAKGNYNGSNVNIHNNHYRKVEMCLLRYETIQ